MDKKLLQSLDNLSLSLAEVASSLEKKNQSTSAIQNALQSGNFSKQLQEISVSIKEIKADTEELLKGQNSLMKVVKDIKENQKKSDVRKTNTPSTSILERGKEEEKSNGLFSKIGDGKNRIMDSVGTIVAIAGGVLAIGVAFKLIGSVDWGSVLALSVSLPLIAAAFSKISEMKLTPKGVLSLILVTSGISAAITASSLILSGVQPISFFQGVTAVMIAGVFSAMSFGVATMIQNFKGINPALALGASIVMPLILVGVSYAIQKSSEFLSGVQPISFFQGVTAVMIAGVFSVISYGVGKMVQGFKGVNPGIALAASIAMPILLIAISGAIAKSSQLLSEVVPMGFFQGITAVMIAGVFSVLAYGVGKMIQGFKGVNPGVAAIAAVSMPLLLIALSGAIAKSSQLLSEVVPIGFFQGLTAVMIAGVMVALSYAVKPLMNGVKGVSYSDILKGSLVMMGVVGMVVGASYLLGKIEEVPLSKIASFTLLSLAVIGSSVAFGYGLQVISKIPLTSILQGSIAVLGIATTITLASLIVSKGEYGLYPSLDWSMGVGASLLAFGLSSVGLGMIVASGIGAVALVAGAVATLGVAGLIVGVDAILANGSYSKFPNMSWIGGVGASLLAFSTSVVMLGAINTIGGVAETLSFGIVKNPIEAGIDATTKIASLIPTVDQILSSGSYNKYPSLSWAAGVGSIMTVFAGSVVMLGGIGLLGSRIFDRGTEAIKSISRTIVDSASILASGKYVGGPTKSWAEGISLALGSFSPVYGILLQNSILKIFGSGVSVESFAQAIKTISLGIVDAAGLFSQNKATFENPPPPQWAEGVGKAISSFSPVYDLLAKGSGWFNSDISADDMRGAVIGISKSIMDSASIFNKGNVKFDESKVPSPIWSNNLKNAISSYSSIFEFINENSGWFGSDIDDVSSSIQEISKSMVLSAAVLSVGKFDKKMDSGYFDSVSKNIQSYFKMFESLKKMEVPSMSEIDKIKRITSAIVGDPLSDKISGIAGDENSIKNTASNLELLAQSFDKLSSSVKNFSTNIGTMSLDKIDSIRSLSSNVIMMSLMDPDQFDQMMDRLEKRSGVFSDLVNNYNADRKSTSATSLSTINVPSKQQNQPNQEMKDLKEMMGSIISLLSDMGMVVGSRGTLKSYLNSQQDDINIGGSR